MRWRLGTALQNSGITPWTVIAASPRVGKPPIIAVCRSIGGVDRLVREFPRAVSDAAAVIAGCHDVLIAFSDAAPSSCQWDTAFPAIVTHFSEVIHRRSARRYPHLNRPAPVPNRQTPNPPRRPRLRVTPAVQREDIDTRPLHIENGFRVVCVKVLGGECDSRFVITPQQTPKRRLSCAPSAAPKRPEPVAALVART